MKKIFLILIAILVATTAGLAQGSIGNKKIESDSVDVSEVLIITGDIIKSTTQQSSIDTIVATKDYVDNNIFVEPRDSILFSNDISSLVHQEGKFYYDSLRQTWIGYIGESDVTFEFMYEDWIRVYNNTGQLITNTQVCYMDGVILDGLNTPTVALANAKWDSTSQSALGFATHDIEPDDYGLLTKSGTVRNATTNGIASGARIVLDTIDGGYTDTPVGSPYYFVSLGNIGRSDISDGTIEVHIDIGGNTVGVINIFNGAEYETVTVDVFSNGTTSKVAVGCEGGGDLSMFFDGQFVIFDTPDTITITNGTDEVPVRNWVYIPNSTRQLTVNTTGIGVTNGFPTNEQYVGLVDIITPSAATAQTDGFYKVHVWTDHIFNPVGQGHLSDVNYWIRKQSATYQTGVSLTTDPLEDIFDTQIEFSTTSGEILQLHPHTYPAKNTATGDRIKVYNDPVTANNLIPDLNSTDLALDSEGGSLSNKYYTVTLSGVISEDPEDCQYFLKLPGGSYTNESNALADANEYTNKLLPIEYKGTIFLAYTITLQNSGGNIKVVAGGIKDLRESASEGGGEGAGGAVTYDELNDTPPNKTVSSNKIVGVNLGETAHEYKDVTIDGSGNIDISGAAVLGTPGQILNASDTAVSGGVVYDFVVGGYVPYTGANANVDIGNYNFTTDTAIIIGERSSSVGSFLVEKTYTTLNRHSFDDYSTLNSVDGFGFGTFDASTTNISTTSINHLMGYQSRLTHNSAANIIGTDGMAGFMVSNTIDGAGTVTNNYGLKIYDAWGTGDITNNYGIYIHNITRGTNDYSIYSVGGANYFGGYINTAGGMNITATINSSIKQNTGWMWTDTGLTGGTIRGGIYASLGEELNLFAGSTIQGQVVINSSGDVGVGKSPTNRLSIFQTSYDQSVANSGQIKISESSEVFAGYIGYEQSGFTQFVFDNSFDGNPASKYSFRFGNSEVFELLQNGDATLIGKLTLANGILGSEAMTRTGIEGLISDAVVWNTDANGINYTAGNVGFGTSSSSSYDVLMSYSNASFPVLRILNSGTTVSDVLSLKSSKAYDAAEVGDILRLEAGIREIFSISGTGYMHISKVGIVPASPSAGFVKVYVDGTDSDKLKLLTSSTTYDLTAGSVSFGAFKQIPVTNTTTDDYDYFTNFVYDGDHLIVGASSTVNTASIIGVTTSNEGVRGKATSGQGIVGSSTTGTAVRGLATIGNGGWFSSDNGTAVLAVGGNIGVDARGDSVDLELGTSGIFSISTFATAPASASAGGTIGTVIITATHIYVCSASNTWVRTALTTW